MVKDKLEDIIEEKKKYYLKLEDLNPPKKEIWNENLSQWNSYPHKHTQTQ